MRRSAPVAVVLIAFTLAFAAATALARSQRVRPVIVTGTVALNGDTPVALLDDVPPPLISPAVEVDGAFGSDCLVPYGAGQRVEVGVLPAAPVQDAIGTDVSVWVKCLSGAEHVEPFRATPEMTSRESARMFPELPRRGSAVRYIGDRWLGSGSQRVGIPDLAPGMTGTVEAAVSPVQIIVEWNGGPTFPVLLDHIEVLPE